MAERLAEIKNQSSTKLKLLLTPVSTDVIIWLACPGSGLTGEKSAVQIGTELLLHGTSHTVSGLRAMPAPRPSVP
jgi:hypothetical protein